MSSELDILRKLKSALSTSCDDAFYFSGDETNLIDVEYLLTVNSAKAIKELNQYFGAPYKIRLEHDTKVFSTSCTPLLGREPANNILGYKSTIRTKNDTKRTGKIDIAVYTSRNGIDVPFCAIELKGFNPSKRNVIQDLERNAEYFSLESRTGQSKLPFAVFIALHSYKNTWDDDKEKSNLDKVKKRYSAYISESDFLNSVNQNVDVFTIRRGLVPNPDDSYIQEYGLQGDEDYHFIGVIITSSSKKLTSTSTRAQQNCAAT